VNWASDPEDITGDELLDCVEDRLSRDLDDPRHSLRHGAPHPVVIGDYAYGRIVRPRKTRLMRRRSDPVWTWLSPDAGDRAPDRHWFRHGGKWIVFDTLARIESLAGRLAPYIDGGEIPGAKYWKGDPSAINVYSLDRDRRRSAEILRDLGATGHKVWEYDHAWDKNLAHPCTFLYSQTSKLWTIARSRGLTGMLGLVVEALRRR
jgi:hypothetical protein